jgi:hypothetical protein
MRRSTVLSLFLQLVFPVTPLEPLTILACPNVKICTTLHGLMQQQAVTENLDYASLMNLQNRLSPQHQATAILTFLIFDIKLVRNLEILNSSFESTKSETESLQSTLKLHKSSELYH